MSGVNDNDDKLFRTALSAKSAGRYEDALHLLSQLIEREPHNPVFHWGLAQCYLEKNAINTALDSLNAAVSIDPEFALAWEGLGLAFWVQGDGEKAEKMLRRRLSLRRDARGLLELASVLGSCAGTTRQWRLAVSASCWTPEMMTLTTSWVSGAPI